MYDSYAWIEAAAWPLCWSLSSGDDSVGPPGTCRIPLMVSILVHGAIRKGERESAHVHETRDCYGTERGEREGRG